jgi:hypothetical protein
MTINWLAAVAQQFLPVEDAGLDEHELSISFDFAPSAEIMDLLYTQNAVGHMAKPATATALPRFALDEYELALA